MNLEVAMNKTRDERSVERDRLVPHLVEHVSRTVSSTASALYRERLGVGLNEARVVISLSRRPRIIAAALAEDTSLDKSTISRTLNGLRARGFVRGHGAADRRRQFDLTAAGRALHARISRLALQREDLMLGGFTADERATLIEYLLRLLQNIPRANGNQRSEGRLERKDRSPSTRRMS
jgi:DNA-binding MarR family transcriptional regulator